MVDRVFSRRARMAVEFTVMNISNVSASSISPSWGGTISAMTPGGENTSG